MTFFSIATSPEGEKSLTVMYENGDITSVPQNHPQFDNLIEHLQSGESNDDTVKTLVNTLLAVGEKLSRISERVSVNTWGVYFDGDPLRGELADTVLRLFKEGDADALKPLVLFMEKAASNPSMDGVDALYRWIKNEDLTITETGDFIGYKGVHKDSEGNLSSIFTGSGFINGELVEGNLPYPIGAVIEMPRSEVDPNSDSYCSVGLHVGTWSYARQYAYGSSRVMIAVLVNPRDVVMVPGDSNEKMRVCRYVILEPLEAKIEHPVVATPRLLNWKKGQLVKIDTNQGLTRVFAAEASSDDHDWLDGAVVREVFDVFENGRNSKGHFVKGFTPKGVVRDSKGRFVNDSK